MAIDPSLAHNRIASSLPPPRYFKSNLHPIIGEPPSIYVLALALQPQFSSFEPNLEVAHFRQLLLIVLQPQATHRYPLTNVPFSAISASKPIEEAAFRVCLAIGTWYRLPLPSKQTQHIHVTTTKLLFFARDKLPLCAGLMRSIAGHWRIANVGLQVRN